MCRHKHNAALSLSDRKEEETNRCDLSVALAHLIRGDNLYSMPEHPLLIGRVSDPSPCDSTLLLFVFQCSCSAKAPVRCDLDTLTEHWPL